MGGEKAFAATLTWTGGGTTLLCGSGHEHDWSCGANWNTGSAPTVNDQATFNSGSYDATIDASFQGTITSLTVTSGYSGTITMARDFITGAMTQQGGGFAVSDKTLYVQDLTRSGGTFTNSSGTIQFSNVHGGTGSVSCSGTIDGKSTIVRSYVDYGFTIGSGCEINLGDDPTTTATEWASVTTLTNNGTITINSGLWTLNASKILNHGTINHNAAGASWIINGNLTNASDGIINYQNGTLLEIRGDLSQQNTTGGFGLTGKTIKMDAGSTTSHTLDCAGDLPGTVVIRQDGIFNGTFTVGSGCHIDLGTDPTTMAGWGAGTLTNSGTITVDGGTWTLLSTKLVNNGTINHLGTHLVIPWDLVNNSGAEIDYPNGVDLTITGNFTQNGTFGLGGKIITMNGNNYPFTLNCTGNLGGTVRVGGVYSTFILGDGCEATMDQFTVAEVKNLTVNSGAILHYTGSTLTVNGNLINNGTIDYSGGTDFRVYGTFTQSGTFNMTGKRLIFDMNNSPATINCTGVLGGKVIYNNESSNPVVNNGCEISLGDAPTTTFRSLTNNGTIDIASGKWTDAPMYDHNHSIINNGTINHLGNDWNILNNFTNNGTVNYADVTANWTIGGTLTNNAAKTIAYGGSALTIGSSLNQSGVFDLTSKTVTFGTTEGSITCSGDLGGKVVINQNNPGGGNRSGLTVAAGCYISLGSDPTSTMISNNGSQTLINYGKVTVESGLWTADLRVDNHGIIDHKGTGWTVKYILTNESDGTILYAGTGFKVNTFNQLGTFDMTGKTVTMTDDSAITCNGVLGGTVGFYINAAAPTYGGFTLGTGCAISLGDNPTTNLSANNGSKRITNNGKIVIESGTWTEYAENGVINNGEIEHKGAGWASSCASWVTSTIVNSGTIKYAGATTSWTTTTNITNNLGSTIIYTGTSGTQAIKDITYSNLTINGAGATYILPADKTVNNLTVTAGTLDLNTHNLSVAGNLINGATLTVGNSDVTLNGTSAQSLTPGGATFKNITVTNSSADGVTFTDDLIISGTLTSTNSAVRKLTFTSGKTYAVKNLSLEGDHALRLTLAATGGSDWNLTDLSGTKSISYVNVAHSNAASLVVATNSIDSGNNTNWNLVGQITVALAETGRVHNDSAVTITLKDAAGTVTAAHSNVTLSVDLGSVSPNSISSSDFVSGVYSGSVQFSRVGTRTLTASTNGVNGQDTAALSPDVLDHFQIVVPGTVTADSAFTSDVAVTAYDSWDNVKTDYSGQIWFASSDTQAVLPFTSSSKYTFTVDDSGSHNFPGSGFTLKTSGNKTLTVSEGTISQFSNNILVGPGALGHFEVSGYPATVNAGVTFATPTNDIVVTVKDTTGNVKTDYAGDVWFTSSDSNGNILLPATPSAKYTFTSGTGMDNGVHTFSGSGFQLATAYTNQTITLTDGAGGAADVTSDNIFVNPGSVNHFTLADYPVSGQTQWTVAGADWSQTAGSGSGAPYDVVVTAYDSSGNIKRDFTGNVWFSVDEGVTATLPYDSANNSYTFSSDGGTTRAVKSDSYDNGRHIFDAESFQIDTAGSSLNFNVNTAGDVSSNFKVKVKPAALATVGVIFDPTITTKLVDNELTESVTVLVYDSAGNIKTDYVGDLYFTSSDPAAVLPYSQSAPYPMTLSDAGSKTFTPLNTLRNYFQLKTGGNQVITAVATVDGSPNITGSSSTVTVSAHAPSDLQATAGHQQVVLDWKNAVDQAMTNVNIYQSETLGELGTKIASPMASVDTYSQYIVSGLTNGVTYYFTLKSVVKQPDQSEFESVASQVLESVPADVVARNVGAIELADGRVKVDYALRYDSTVSLEYYDVSTSTWRATSSAAISGDFDDQQGSSDLTNHTLYWQAGTDYISKYYSVSDGFKVRVKVVVPTQGNSTGYSPSSALAFDTKAPSNLSLSIDASAGDKATLTIHAEDDHGSTVQMMVSNDPTFTGKSWQAYSTSISNWDISSASTIYARFTDSYSNISSTNSDIVPVIENFAIRDNSDSRIPSYILFLSWAEAKIGNVDKYIVERQIGSGDFVEINRTTQLLYVDAGLTKGEFYSYRIKVLARDGSISRPSSVLASSPGLAPDISAKPTVQVFGYKQEIGVRAIIKWITDQPADSFVAYSTEQLSNLSNTQTLSGVNSNVHGQLDRTTSHEVTITGLLPGKTYYYKVLSQNDIKITGYSDVYTLTTPQYIPLVIDGLSFSELTPNSVWVSWQTNKLSKTDLYYGAASNFNNVKNDINFNTDHKFKLDELTAGVEYRVKIIGTDEDGNTVSSDVYALSTPSNPVVSDIAVQNVSNNSAVVSWTTNVATDSGVQYGKDTAYGLQSSKTDLVTKHEVTVVGLESKTTYHFRVNVKDTFGTLASSADLTFTTTSDTTPPVVSGVQSQLSEVSTPQGIKYQAVISWQTDEGSTSQVEYGDNAVGQYDKKTQEDPSYNMTHVVILTDLKPNAAYSYRVISHDTSSNEARSGNNTIITPPQEQSLLQLVLNSLEETFSWVGKFKLK
ncbi:MAG: fibronectin type III domain-containing protein [Candidatus Berkelbacteria bacterium]|nr:fibronectin type III domain-containing protein [Candidatus Berkelbacteria bacterium]